MTIAQLSTKATDKTNFTTIQGYIDFCQSYLEFIAHPGNIQAVIVARNENHYRFWQYGQSAGYQITRPINSQLMYQAGEFSAVQSGFLETLANLRDMTPDQLQRDTLINTIYTIQQSIGAALDGLVGNSNGARKINGDLFERFIQLILAQMGINAVSGVVKVPIMMDGRKEFDMTYQHDLIIKYEGEVKAIGSVKTTSKDRIDKIFMDKFLYSKLTDSDLPHIAIFLNDVQRTGKAPNYGVGSTFLPGHFKGYTVKLNPLDGVYYCDIRPNMRTEPIIRDHVKTIDHLLFTDIWSFLQHEDTVPIVVEEETED